MENRNGKSKPLIKQHCHTGQSSQEHFVLDMDVVDHHEKLKQDSTDSEGQFSLSGLGIQSPLLSSPESVTYP